MLTAAEQKLFESIESRGLDFILKFNFIWCYLDGKRNGCKTFDERLKQIASGNKLAK